MDVAENSVSLDNAPYCTTGLIQTSAAPLLTEDECQTLIDAAELHAKNKGWGGGYTYSDETQELHVSDVPVARVILDKLLSSCLLPACAETFPAAVDQSSKLRAYNALIVKYDVATGKTHMSPHADFGLFTLNIALNDAGTDFKGGGTWFQAKGETLCVPKGHGILHASSLAHLGAPILEGQRYILTIFLISEDWTDLPGRFQTKGAEARGNGNLDLSARLLNHAIRANGLDPESWYQLGVTQQKLGNLGAAETAFRRAVQLGDLGESPNFEAVFNLGCMLQALNRTEEAAGAFQKAVELGAPPSPMRQRKDLDAQHNWGLTLLSMKRYEDAGLIFEQVINEDPNAAESWASLGVCMAALEQDEAALACQRQVIKIKEMASKYALE